MNRNARWVLSVMLFGFLFSPQVSASFPEVPQSFTNRCGLTFSLRKNFSYSSRWKIKIERSPEYLEIYTNPDTYLQNARAYFNGLEDKLGELFRREKLIRVPAYGTSIYLGKNFKFRVYDLKNTLSVPDASTLGRVSQFEYQVVTKLRLIAKFEGVIREVRFTSGGPCAKVAWMRIELPDGSEFIYEPKKFGLDPSPNYQVTDFIYIDAAG